VRFQIQGMPSDTTKGNTEQNRSPDLAARAKRILCRFEALFTDARYGKPARVALFLLTALAITCLILPSGHFRFTRFVAGDIATADIKANQKYLFEDREQTEKMRSDAERGVLNVYEIHPGEGAELKKRFSLALSSLADVRSRGNWNHGALRNAFARDVGSDVSPREIDALLRIRNYKSLSTEIVRAVDKIYGKRVVADVNSFSADRNRGIMLMESGTGRLIGAGELSISVIDLDAARAIIRSMRVPSVSKEDLDAVKGLVERNLQPDLTFNRASTDARKAEARNSVKPFIYQIQRGEMIVREGERISAEQALKLNRVFDVGRGMNRLFMGSGIFGLLLVLIYFPYRFGRKNIRKFNLSGKDMVLLALVTITMFLLLKVAYAISTAMGILLPEIGTDDYLYLFPFAAGAMLIRIILNSEVALIYCAVTAPFLGIMFGNSLQVAIYALMGGVIGAHGVRQCQSRGTIYSAGVKISVINAALALQFQILADNLFTSQSLYIIIFALIGGVVNAVVVAGIVPVVESLFHYTTDIKLLELASLNSPVLRELMIRAPGTYHHSILVGTMVEAAAEAINANPLLARVAAYYHDIGKISKPLYFIENMVGGENRHDKLSPSMSSLILISHVKEGVELAKEKRLGLPIIDVIRQHHGTGLITYFFRKAKGGDGSESKVVDERDFRYPGPKPQTREAGLVMLADCVEAASKTLTDPTPARIQGMVQKIINNIFIDGQLEECELTLKNLHDIAKSFNRVLAGIYHQRIDYPEPAFKVNGRKKILEDSNREQTTSSSSRDEDSAKSGAEDLKRLGINR
jgi:cyclic-di-AMP phosphodiesterase PgpH